MVDSPVPRGLLISALGSAVLAVSMFLPWYSFSITPAGAAEAQQQFAVVAQQYGNANLQAMANRIGAQFSSVAGRPLTTMTAHQALKDISAILLLLAAVALLGSLLRLAGVSEIGGGQIALVGFVAALGVSFECSPRQARTRTSSRCRLAGAAGSRSPPPPQSSAGVSGRPSPTRAARRTTILWAT
jgi:hypothetical protein